MEITSIRQLLKSLCDYTQWNYAVFWKLNHYLPATLTWEEGYYSYQKTNEAVEIICSNINFEASDEVFSSSIESSGGSADYSVQLLMTEMSTLKYTLGEGIVGRISLKRDHCWVFCEDVLTSNLNNNLISECPYEWLLQFASGIKTIVLVPVLPHGVLQFGSFEGVAEDLAFVANIKERFNSYCNSLLSSDIDIQASMLSSLTDCKMDNLDVLSSIMNNKLKAKLSGGTSLNNNGLTRLYPTEPSFVQEEYCAFGEDQLEFLGKENKNEINSSYIRVLNDPIHISQEEMNLSQMEDNLSGLCQWINRVGESGEVLNRTCFDSIKDMTEQKFGGTDTDHKICLDTGSLFDFSSNCELSEALGAVASGQTAESLSKYFSVEDTYSCSTLMSNKKEQDHVKDLQFLQESEAEYLLNAVVGNLDNIPPQSHSEESTLVVNYSDPKNHLTPALMAKGMEDFSNLVTSTPFDDNSSISIDETQKKVYGHMQPKSGPRLSSTSKKRARDSNTKKPRPRDRQLIMDRMKELRELVPEGVGCSIDNLLERTIKHMLYLQNITNQAEKLKQCMLQEVPECRKQKIKTSYEGRSCAFDFESEDQVCPIIIEDLGCSGNMLIEMICREQGLFLEIANVIRRMELTILKGVLESRSGTTWACFIIEVPRGFHRMDIMCPLLHLLQLSKNPVSDRNSPFHP